MQQLNNLTNLFAQAVRTIQPNSGISVPTNGNLTPTKNIICGGRCPFIDSAFNFTSRDDIATFIIGFARFLTYLAVPIAIIMIIYNGILMIFGAAGDKPWQPILNVIIGLAIVILAYTFTAGFSDILSTGIDLKRIF
jgi:TrbC/VIRB2 pilin